jgi:integral membrane sensor domain MASE1
MAVLARWYASNALGSLTLGPLALICLEKIPFSIVSPVRRRLEALLIAVVLGPDVHCRLRTGANNCNRLRSALLYLPLPIHRVGSRAVRRQGASGAIMVVSLVLIWRTLNGPSPFVVGSAEANVFAMQLFLIGCPTPILLLGSAIEETRHAETVTRDREARISLPRRRRALDYGNMRSRPARFGRPTIAASCSIFRRMLH